MNGMALCAGAGGLELGMRIALGDAYRTVVYVERDAYAAACLVARMEDAALEPAPIWDDLTTFDGPVWRGCVDIVTAGFPCQPWSQAGARKGTDDERWLWPDIARIIRDVDPGAVFLENVSGLLSGGLEHVLGSLADIGFDAEWCVLGASDVGASHRRKRLWILAHAVGHGCREAQGQREPAQASHAGPRSDCAAVADAARLPGGERAGRERVCGPSQGIVADAQGLLGGCERETGRGSVQRATADWPSEGSLWPPTPGDVSAWERVPPSAQPSICRDSDGLAYRMDRLRLTGNGVVPVVAAVAYLRLRDRLMEPAS